MIRTALLFIYILGFIVYAWRRDWFVSLCAAMALLAVNQHPDMPRSMLGIPGASPLNLFFLGIMTAWIVKRGGERLRFNPPPFIAVCAFLYFVVMLVAWVRFWNDHRPDVLDYYPRSVLIVDLLFNSIKWVVPGLLLFDGARTPQRMRLALGTLAALYTGFALQVFHWVPPWLIASGDALQYRALREIENQMGFSRVNMAMMMAGGSWAILCAREAFADRRLRLLGFGLFVTVSFACALTAGRTGYVTWAAIGLVLAFLRWRRYLILGPVLVLAVVSFVPAVKERALTGVEETGFAGEEVQLNEAEMTSDRAIIWPAVIEKIKENPVVGYGLEAMTRTGLFMEYRELSFPHPHNAYLEVLLNAGIVGLLPVVGFFLAVLFHAGRLFLLPRSATERAVGGTALALTLALLIAAYGSQHFLPQEGGAGMWAAIGLAIRASVDRPGRRRRLVRQPDVSETYEAQAAAR